jgi:MFS family permease
MNRCIKILLFVAYAWSFEEGLLGPLYAIFAEKIGGDILSISSIYAAYAIAGGLFYLVFGKISDAFKSERMLMESGYLLNTIATFGYLIVNNPTTLLIIELMLGIAAAMASPTWDVVFMKYIEDDTKTQAWGAWEGGDLIMRGLSMIAGGALVFVIGFPPLFVIMGFISLAGTISIYAVRDDACFRKGDFPCKLPKEKREIVARYRHFDDGKKRNRY